MGKGGHTEVQGSQKVTWEEVKTHNTRDDKWLVIGEDVYDVTNWSKTHPGGPRLLTLYAGQDATEAFQAFHIDHTKAEKFLVSLPKKGYVEKQELSVQEDFKQLRKTAEKMNLFKPSFWFFFLSLAHILAFDAVGFLIMIYYGTGWIPCIISVLCLVIAQGQASWLQHDCGHLSIFKSRKPNHILHHFINSFIKGISANWWNHMHYQHHAKPNVIDKDPDVRVEKLFVVGDVMPVKIAQTVKKFMPYNWQHRYFFVLGPPLLFPLYFQFMLFKHLYNRKMWLELAFTLIYYIRHFCVFIPLLGIFGAIVHYFMVRMIESCWFTWVSQSNHIPMTIAPDESNPWVPLQIHATCDVEKSFFNDWFTGHLNFQIEHHLFPTMPRHNLYKIAPLARSLCEKHGVPYIVKPIGTAFWDIVKSLRHSGEIWYSTYHALNCD